jgi:dolichol-phosphate mannosyltransferase
MEDIIGSKISIVIPTKNEADNISNLLLRIMRYGYEVIIVDDSDDATATIAKNLGARVIRGQGKGLGQAIIDGMKISLGDIVVVMDADLSHSPDAIPDLIKPILEQKYDMTIGSRYVKGGKTIGWSIPRKIISRVAGFFAYPVAHIRDGTSGFFAVRKSVLDGVVLRPDSWKIMLEIKVKANLTRVIELPIRFEDRKAGKSKLTLMQWAAYLKHLFLLVMYHYSILNFMLVGGLGYIINMGIYYPLTLVFKNEVSFLGQHFYLPPFVISSLVAISCNYYFNKVWTFRNRQARSLSFFRYLGMAMTTLLFDMLVLFALVDYGGIKPIPAAAIAILVVFALRYLIADKWIWHGKNRRIDGTPV